MSSLDKLNVKQLKVFYAILSELTRQKFNQPKPEMHGKRRKGLNKLRTRLQVPEN